MNTLAQEMTEDLTVLAVYRFYASATLTLTSRSYQQYETLVLNYAS